MRRLFFGSAIAFAFLAGAALAANQVATDTFRKILAVELFSANAAFGIDGAPVIVSPASSANFVSGVISSAMTGTTSTSLVAAPASGLRNYITACTFSNSHATVGTDMILQDGSGGTTIWIIPAAAVFGGAHITFPTPLKQPTTATALYVANVTSGAATKASCSGFKGA